MDSVVEDGLACGPYNKNYGAEQEFCMQLHENEVFGDWFRTCYDKSFHYFCNGSGPWITNTPEECANGVFGQLCTKDDECDEGSQCVVPAWFSEFPDNGIGACTLVEDT